LRIASSTRRTTPGFSVIIFLMPAATHLLSEQAHGLRRFLRAVAESVYGLRRTIGALFSFLQIFFVVIKVTIKTI
jgi:hypothetical protein